MKTYTIKLSDLRKIYLEFAPRCKPFIRLLKEHLVFKKYFKKLIGEPKTQTYESYLTETPKNLLLMMIAYSFGWDSIIWVNLHTEWTDILHDDINKHKLTCEIEKIIEKYAQIKE